MQNPILLISLALFVFISGCSSQQVENTDQADVINVDGQPITSPSEQALAEADALFEQAINDDLSFYSPSSMVKATQSIALARDNELNGFQTDSLAASQQTMQFLKDAKKNKALVEKNLRPLIQQKKVLEALNAPLVIPTQYNNQLNSIQTLISEIENDQVVISDERIQLTLNDFRLLEFETLLSIHWLPAQNTLEKAKNESADIYAPISFLAAQEQLAQTKIDISNDMRDINKIEISGKKSLRAAQHALYLARDAQLLIQMNNQRAEIAVINMEKLLQKISRALKVEDVNYMSLLDQANAIAQAAETQASRLSATLNARIAELENQRRTNDNSTPDTLPK